MYTPCVDSLKERLDQMEEDKRPLTAQQMEQVKVLLSHRVKLLMKLDMLGKLSSVTAGDSTTTLDSTKDRNNENGDTPEDKGKRVYTSLLFSRASSRASAAL
jgi:hypothetical protein